MLRTRMDYKVIVLLMLLEYSQPLKSGSERQKTRLKHLLFNKTYQADSRSLEEISHETADRYIYISTGGESVVLHYDEAEGDRAMQSEDTELVGSEDQAQRAWMKRKPRHRSTRHLRSPLSRRRVRTVRRRLRRLSKQGLQSHVAHVRSSPPRTETPVDHLEQWKDE